MYRLKQCIIDYFDDKDKGDGEGSTIVFNFSN